MCLIKDRNGGNTYIHMRRHEDSVIGIENRIAKGWVFTIANIIVGVLCFNQTFSFSVFFCILFFLHTHFNN